MEYVFVYFYFFGCYFFDFDRIERANVVFPFQVMVRWWGLVAASLVSSIAVCCGGVDVPADWADKVSLVLVLLPEFSFPLCPPPFLRPPASENRLAHNVRVWPTFWFLACTMRNTLPFSLLLLLTSYSCCYHQWSYKVIYLPQL